MAEAISANETIRQLCPRCGVCCNGVLFRDVQLRGGDASRLRSLGLVFQKLSAKAGVAKFTATRRPARLRRRLPQPCAALGPACRCQVYADRPQHCRDFECALFKAVVAGTMTLPSARRLVRSALKQAEQVKGLLRQLGDATETRPLAWRFKRMRQRLEAGIPDKATAEAYSQLTLAVHDLNLLLRAAFYPAHSD
jgi:uncharacterized protein